MALESQISQDLKAAMLAGEQQRVTTLRGLKSTLLYAKVAQKLPREQELADDEVVSILARESKKRQESADLYVQGGSQERADAELQEKAIIDAYLPDRMSDDKLASVIAGVVEEMGASSPQDMGKVIGAVRQKVGVSADGASIARMVKEKLAL